MKNNSNPLNTILLVILALIVSDLFLNDGRVLASIAANAEDTTAVPYLEGQNLNNLILPPAATAAPGVTFTIVDDNSEPAITNLVPQLPPTAVPQQEPEAIIDYAEMLARPTATVRPLTDEQLLACAAAQQDGRRLPPHCPTNAAELLGPGR
jgi:hypothetical protein